MTITLFELVGTRSERARWTLLELDLPFESITGREVFGSAALAAVHPLKKLPALLDDGRPLFESAAICTWLADSHPDKRLIAAPGTWARAQHDQWVAFTLAELEANLWSTARNRFIYSEAERVTAIYEQNAREARRAIAVIDAHLVDTTWLVGDQFSVTDIIVGYALDWARKNDLTTGFSHVTAYCDRLLARPKCPFERPT